MLSKTWMKLGGVILIALTMSLAACDKSSSDTVLGQALGNFIISITGGDGAANDGGDGGDIYIESYGRKGVTVTNDSAFIDTAFVVPGDPETNMGTDGVTILADYTVIAYDTQLNAQAATADGDLYLFLGSSGLWVRDSVNGDYTASGLTINPGATLTLGLNQNWYGNTGQDTAYINIDTDSDNNGGDVVIHGTVRAATLDTGTAVGTETIETRCDGPATDRDPGLLYINASNRIVQSIYGSIDNSGDDADVTGTRGGDGGGIYLWADDGLYLHGLIDASGGNGLGTGGGGSGARYGSGCFASSYDVDLESDGMVVITGSLVTADGGDGDYGGDAGDIYVYSETHVYNTSYLFSNGGDATNGDGGYGGDIELNAYYGSVFNSNTIQANGGDAGGTGYGGDAGDIDLQAGDEEYAASQLVNGGLLQANGGDAVGAGDGGYGGDLTLDNGSAGPNRNFADLHAMGGDGAGSGYYGGDGGDLTVYSDDGEDEGWGEYLDSQNNLMGGNILLDGGDGDYGGDGGDIDIYDDDQDDTPNDHGVYLLGYTSVNTSGGDGDDGGYAGYWDIYTYSAWGVDYFPVGPIFVQTDFYAMGGDGTNGWGGDGNSYYTETDGDNFDENSTNTFIGSALLNGGDGTMGGGGGEYFEIYGWESANVSGVIDVSGGDGTGAGTDGGDGDWVGIYATKNVNTSGTIWGTGGDATGAGFGGDGAWIEFNAGGQVINSMDIDVSGGDSDLVSGTGGWGGGIEFFSEWSFSYTTGAWDISEGAGMDDGVDREGEVWIDQTLYDGID